MVVLWLHLVHWCVLGQDTLLSTLATQVYSSLHLVLNKFNAEGSEKKINTFCDLMLPKPA